ncbi:hypothetical protein DPMN_090948, partial [Dreissena polymorpha]
MSTPKVSPITRRKFPVAKNRRVISNCCSVDRDLFRRVYRRKIGFKRSKFICLPTAPGEIRREKEDFYNIARFPNVIGVIDGTHVQIQAPHVDEPAYVNQIGHHSINTQKTGYIALHMSVGRSVGPSTKWFPDDDSRTLGPRIMKLQRIMKLHRYIDHDSHLTPIDFQVTSILLNIIAMIPKDVDMTESLQCGPCRTCRRRAELMVPKATENSIGISSEPKSCKYSKEAKPYRCQDRATLTQHVTRHVAEERKLGRVNYGAILRKSEKSIIPLQVLTQNDPMQTSHGSSASTPILDATPFIGLTDEFERFLEDPLRRTKRGIPSYYAQSTSSASVVIESGPSIVESVPENAKPIMQQPHFTLDNDIAKLFDEDSDCDSDDGLDFHDEECNTNHSPTPSVVQSKAPLSTDVGSSKMKEKNKVSKRAREAVEEDPYSLDKKRMLLEIVLLEQKIAHDKEL